MIVKLIRSKGVGLIFITQNPTDIPSEVLSQLGLKVQHALRAFTPKDRKAIKLVAQNYPVTEHYDVEDIITRLGTGEALITALDEDGIPSPLVHTMLRAPQSRMDVLTKKEISDIIRTSALVPKYDHEIDRESAHEILSERIRQYQEKAHQEKMREQWSSGRRYSSRRKKSVFEEILDSRASRELGRTMARELTRGLCVGNKVADLKTTASIRVVFPGSCCNRFRSISSRVFS